MGNSTKLLLPIFRFLLVQRWSKDSRLPPNHPPRAGSSRPVPITPLSRVPPAVQRQSLGWSLNWVAGALLVGIVWTLVGERPQPLPVSETTFQSEPTEGAAAEPLAAAPSWQQSSFPVENFVSYTSPFGYRQHPDGGKRFHYGLDIAAPMGSYIRAWWEGTVVEVSDDTACGTSVVIRSGDWLHIYCHLQGHVVVEPDSDRWLVDTAGGIQLRQGARVMTGQQLGRVGMTGRTTGPHLHWGLKFQGNWVDPGRVLQAMIQGQQR